MALKTNEGKGMSEQQNANMNLTLNKLPAKTWNHLKMNEVFVQDVKIPHPQMYKEITDGNVPEGLAIHLADEEEKKIFDSIETALGADMDKLGKTLPVMVIESFSGSGVTGISLNITSDGTYSRYFLHAKKNSKTNIAVYCTSEEMEKDSLFFQLKIYAEENAKVDLAVVQTAGKQIRVFSDIGGILEQNAAVDLVKMELGGQKAYSGACMDLKGNSSSFQAHIGYLGEENQYLDMNYIARHHGKKTESLMESNGVLSKNAFKLFRGTIDFVKGCTGSAGNETEDVLLLGDNVVNQTIPLILCAEEDVEGNHGASIGELDEKTLFYLMSRGFSKESAEKMIARARLDAVAQKIQNPSLREKTLKYLEEHK